jgi:cytochrome c-type biogenesis protein CcmF
LQDPLLAIHPPILYLGYVGTSIIFSTSLAAVTQNYVTKEWAVHIKFWILISWIFLTIGIMLGSIWAYYELGWGGFWFWDPVENVSLMPWLCLTALLHSILVLEKRSLLISWTVILSIATFSLSMTGTFLVRSGILNSVHTFANDPARGIFILIFLFILIAMSLIIFFLFHNENKNENKKINLLSKETSILVNNWFLMYFLSVVLIGTVYPIFLEVLTNHKISIGPPFFNKLLSPFLILFLISMSIGPNLNWINSKVLKINFKLIILFILSLLISFLLLKNIGSKNLINTVLLSSAFYLFFITIKDFFSKNFKNYSQKLSHFGFSLLILSILLNSIFSTEEIINLKVGEKHIFEKGSITFKSIKNQKIENYQSIIGNFAIEDTNKKIIHLSPELRFYENPITVTSEADIKNNLYSDNFLVMNLVKGNDYFNIRYQEKAFMIWIWMSVLIMVIGIFTNILKKKYEK